MEILYWACLALGGVYLVCTFLMGTLSHGAHHVGDMAHGAHLDIGGHAHVDAGHVGHVDAGHVGHADGGHAHAHIEGGHHAQHGDGQQGDQSDESKSASGQFSMLRYLNPLAISGFLVGFGWSGIFARMLKAGGPASVVCAVLGGWAMWYIAYWIASRVFAASGGTSHYRCEDIVGLRARVTAPIAGEKPGMVCYTVAGTRQSVRAITDETEPIPMGATVRIRTVEHETARVVRLD